jgi:uncharacterized protein YwqG
MEDFPQMIDCEGKLNYVTLDNCQQVGEKLEKELEASLTTCAKLHKVAFILIFKVQLPRIEDLGEPKIDEQVVLDLEENMKEKEREPP